MKSLIVLVAIVSVGYSFKIDYNDVMKKIQSQVKEAQGSSSEELEDFVRGELKDMTGEIELELCGRNGTKLYEAVMKSVDCAMNAQVDGLICDVLTTNFKKCIKPIEQVFENCLVGSLHDIPQYLVDAVSSTSQFICNARVKELAELLNPCLVKIDSRCAEALNNEMNTFDPLSSKNFKTMLCNETAKQRNCFITEVNKSCKNDVTRKTFADFYDAALTKPCLA